VDPANDALFHALVAGDPAGVERALGDGADPDALTPRGWPLCVAAASGDADSVRALIDAGADPDVLDDDDRSPLSLALTGDHREVVAILRAAGADEHPSPSPDRALCRAVEADDPELIASLLSAGARTDARDDRTPTLGMTPLHLAASLGRVAALQSLLVAGARVDDRRDRFGALGETPLCLAARGGWVGAARRLLLAGARVDAPGADDRAAVHEAARANHPEMLQLLVDAGADIEARDGDGRTPLLLASLEGQLPAIEALLVAGADVHATDPGQTTALAAAVRRRDPQMVDRLLRAGADPRWRTGEASVAEEAMESGHPEIRRLVAAALGVANQEALARRSSRPPPDSPPSSSPVIDVEVDIDEDDDIPPPPLDEDAGNAAPVLAEAPAPADSDEPMPVELDDDDLVLLDDDASDDARDDTSDDASDDTRAHGEDADAPEAPPTGHATFAPTPAPPPPTPSAPPAPRFVVPVRVSELGRYERPDVLDRLRAHAGDEGFTAALETLSAWVGGAPRPRSDDLGGVELDLPPGGHLDLDGLQDQLLPLGALVFCSRTAPGTNDPGRLVALPSRDPWDALAAIGTRAPSRGLGTLELIGWMKGLEARHSLNVTWVEPFRISGRFRVPIGETADDLARDMDDLCPGIVSEGTGTVARLAESLRRTGKFHFWWR